MGSTTLKTISMSCSGKANLNTDQIARALRPRRRVGFFAHLARDRKRLIDIEDVERLFHLVVEAAPKCARILEALA